MICDRYNSINVRRKDGARFTVIRCADPGQVHFAQNVTEEQCRQCPRFVEAASAESAKAGEAVPRMPGLVRRGVTWTEAALRWVAAGRPERSDEEVQCILETFCAGTSPCDWYDAARQVCRGCGCNVTSGGHAIFNKIRMATEHCPRNLW